MKNKGNKNIKKILYNVCNVVFYTIFFVLIFLICLIGIYYFMAKHYAKKGVDYQPPISLYMIISPSMVPNINVYDVVVNKRVNDVNKLKVGDIITFRSNSIISNGLTVTHRIYKIEKHNDELIFTTKGDNNQNPDLGTITKKDIYGQVMLKIPQLGRVTYFLGNKGMLLILIVIPALGIIIYDILKLFKIFDLEDKVLDKNSKKINSKRSKKGNNKNNSKIPCKEKISDKPKDSDIVLPKLKNNKSKK